MFYRFLRNVNRFLSSLGCLSIFQRVPGWHPWAILDFNPFSAKVDIFGIIQNYHFGSAFELSGWARNEEIAFNSIAQVFYEILTLKVPTLKFRLIFFIPIMGRVLYRFPRNVNIILSSMGCSSIHQRVATCQYWACLGFNPFSAAKNDFFRYDPNLSWCECLWIVLIR